MTYGEHAVLDTSVASAVKNLIAGTIPAAELTRTRPATTGGPRRPRPTTTPGSTPNTTPITAPPNATVAQLLSQANDLFNQANAALANQDLATFDKDYKQAVALVAQANALSSGTTPTTTPTSTSTTDVPTTTSAQIRRTSTTPPGSKFRVQSPGLSGVRGLLLSR